MTRSQARRSVLIAATIIFCGAFVAGASEAQERYNPRQGWSTKTKNDWYTRSQGSRLIPLGWLLALEQPNSEAPFLDDSLITRFRYLPSQSQAPDRLPVGFAVDQRDDRDLSVTSLRWKAAQPNNEKWVGMNCAACHTAEITFDGKRVRIEGGPALADFQGFMETLNEALIQTRDRPDKNARFAAKVLQGAADTPGNRSMLNDALSQLIAWQLKVQNANATPGYRYGFGRLDAFGNIFNKVALVLAKDSAAVTNPSDAPVSYPFLWNVPQHDKVQWNGIVTNTRVTPGYDIGALGRNVGEVTGVFADVRFKKGLLQPHIISSADVGGLNILENKLLTLRPPLWPTGVLGKLDQNVRDEGREIFRGKDPRANQRVVNGQPIASCASCHLPLGRNNLHSPINARMTSVRDSGTDIWMACNAITRETSTGWFKNQLAGYLPLIDSQMRFYGETAAISDLLRTTVVATIWAKKGEIAGDIFRTILVPTPGGLGSDMRFLSLRPLAPGRSIRAPEKEARFRRCMDGTDPLLAYKARPLNGVWATAPYLHNGSVPTLYDLLLPPDQRPKSFPLGTREFDPQRVGYVTRGPDGQIAPIGGDNSFMFETRDAADRLIDGNSNEGHDYGNATYNEKERWAIVEYLKGL